jgi:hypothetical protein
LFFIVDDASVEKDFGDEFVSNVELDSAVFGRKIEDTPLETEHLGSEST